MSIQKTRELFIDEIQYYKALRCSGLSEVSPARIKSGNVRIFLNHENSTQTKAKITTSDAANNHYSNSTAAESVKWSLELPSASNTGYSEPLEHQLEWSDNRQARRH